MIDRNKHVIVISVDAMITSDIDEFDKRKNMHALLSNSSRVNSIHCIYPTYTYPCHASIMTGCYPNKHGIYHNDIFNPHDDFAKWFWYSDSIKCPTMIDVASQAGLKTSSVTFPVQGASKADYLIAEIWTKREDDDPTEVFRRANSKAVEHIFEKNKHLLNWLKTPAFDYFASACAVDIIGEYKPNLMFVHFSYLDHQRHKCGSATSNVLHAIDFIDERIGDIMTAVEDAGIIDNTDFIVLGDHGHIDVDYVFNINKLFVDRGLITLKEDGTVKSWKMFAHSASFSSHIYINEIDRLEAERILKELREEYPEYIERVMNRFEVNEIYHLNGPFEFVLEGQTHIVFGSRLTEPLVEKPEQGYYKYSVSTHGYAPEKGPNPPFIISGPSARKGVVIKEARLVDEAPTIMALFGLNMPEAIDGRAIKELICQ